MSVWGEESLTGPENTNSSKEIILPTVNASRSFKLSLVFSVPTKMVTKLKC